MTETINIAYCDLVSTDKVSRNNTFGHPMYEVNMQLNRLDNIDKEYLVQLYQECQMNKIVEMIKKERVYEQPILIIYAQNSELLGIQGDDGKFIRITPGKPNNIIIIDDIFLLQEINPEYLYLFIFDHPELITNEEDCELYAETTEQEKEDHLNEVKLILDRFLERYDPNVAEAKMDSDYVFAYCVDYEWHEKLSQKPWPYLKYISRSDCKAI